MYINKLLLRTGMLTMSGLSLFQSDGFTKYMDVTKEIAVTSEHQLNDIELVKYYSKVYELDEKVVLNKFLEITNNFKDYNWLINYSINNDLNEELAILSVVRDISKNPEEYNLTRENIKSGVEYEPNDTCEELVQKYCDLVGINKEVAMSIVYTECDIDLDSYNYLKRNNPAGMGPHNTYENIEQGIVEFVFLLKDGYNCEKNSDTLFLKNISRKYCTSGSQHWYSMASAHYNKVSDDYYCYAKNREYQKTKKY